MNIDKIYLGIDWGTHSSKWAADIITKEGENLTKSGLIKSDLLFHDKEITIDPSDEYHQTIERIISLKRNIIHDPYSPFWEYDRKDIGMPLGMGVTFSICSLLGDFLYFLKSEGISFDSSIDLEIGFSFPNWLDDKDNKSKNAVNNYHQAIIVSCGLFLMNTDELPIPSKPYPLAKWKDFVNDVFRKLDLPEQSDIKISDMTVKKYNLSNFNISSQNNFNWRYLVESCAAGLPYLRNIELIAPPGLPGLGKILVIDVGAGSTDIGYMLRTITTSDTENLFYFTPAHTLSVAGNDLTDKIKSYHEAAGKFITFPEAEAFKITKTDEWIHKSFADIWRKTISEYIKDYIEIVPDKRWLEVDITLHIVITGGSGFVDGLADEIKLGVVNGLRQRGLSESITNKITLIDASLFGWTFSDREDYARRAVAIGSTDRDKPALKHLDKTDPPAKRHTFTPTTKYK